MFLESEQIYFIGKRYTRHPPTEVESSMSWQMSYDIYGYGIV